MTKMTNDKNAIYEADGNNEKRESGRRLRKRPASYAGWTVIAGRRGWREWTRERRGLITLAASLLIAATAVAWVCLFGPVAGIIQMSAGRRLIAAGDYSGAAGAFRSADRGFLGMNPRALLALGQSLSGDSPAEAAEAFRRAVAAYGGTFGRGSASKIVDATRVFVDGGAANGDFFVFGDAARDAIGKSELGCAYYFYAEALAYAGDPAGASRVADDGISAVSAASGDSLWLTALRDAALVTQPTSLSGGGTYQGSFALRFDPVPEGVSAYYTSDGSEPGVGGIPYEDGIEIGVGESVIRAVNVNKYGNVSAEAVFAFLVLDGASNSNGNSVNGGMVAISGEQVYFSDSNGINRVSATGASDSASRVTRIVSGEDIRALNAVGEELYFARGDTGGIYRARIDGASLEKLSRDTPDEALAVGGRLYYTARGVLRAIRLADVEPSQAVGENSSAEDAAAESFVDGDVRCLNYAGDRLFFVMDAADDAADVSSQSADDGTGAIYSMPLSGGEPIKMAGRDVAFMQISGDIAYYVVEGESEPYVRAAYISDGSEAPGVAISSFARFFNVTDGRLIYFDEVSGALRSVAVGGAASEDYGDAYGGRIADDLGEWGKVSSVSVAGGFVYGGSSVGENGASAGVAAARTPREGGVAPEILSRQAGLEAAVFGGGAYAISTQEGSRSVYSLDGAESTLVLSGLPTDETPLFADDTRVITGDFEGLSIYLLDVAAGENAGEIEGETAAEIGDGSADGIEGETAAETGGGSADGIPPDDSPSIAVPTNARGQAIAPIRLRGGEGRVLVGVDKITLYENQFWFASAAGFFAADTELSSAKLISSAGPKSGEPYVIGGGFVYYQQGENTGAPGIYEMRLSDGVVRRVHDGLAMSLELEIDESSGAPRRLYFTSVEDMALYRLNVADGELDRFSDLVTDSVIVAAPGIIARDIGDGHSMKAIASGSDMRARSLVAGGVEGAVASADGFLYYNLWTDDLALYCASLPDALLPEKVGVLTD